MSWPSCRTRGRGQRKRHKLTSLKRSQKLLRHRASRRQGKGARAPRGRSRRTRGPFRTNLHLAPNDLSIHAPSCMVGSSHDSSFIGCWLTNFRNDWSCIMGSSFVLGLMEHCYVHPLHKGQPLSHIPWKFKPLAQELKQTEF